MLKSLLVVVFLAILAGANAAQQSSRTGAQPAQANPCDAANTQIEMNHCSADEYKKADAHLNYVYTNPIRLPRKDSSHTQQQSGGEQRKPETLTVAKLRAMQRRWIRYRDLHCSAVRAQYEGGTISPTMWNTCMTETSPRKLSVGA